MPVRPKRLAHFLFGCFDYPMCSLPTSPHLLSSSQTHVIPYPDLSNGCFPQFQMQARPASPARPRFAIPLPAYCSLQCASAAITSRGPIQYTLITQFIFRAKENTANCTLWALFQTMFCRRPDAENVWS